MLKKSALLEGPLSMTYSNKRLTPHALLGLLFAFSLLGPAACDRYEDPNAKYYPFMNLQEGEKPLQLKTRRINLNKSLALEILLVHKKDKESPWCMTILKKKPGKKEYKTWRRLELAPKTALLDRLLVQDFFLDGFNSVELEFSLFEDGSKLNKKRVLLARAPFDKPLLQREFALDPQNSRPTTDNDKKTKKKKDSQAKSSPIHWEDTNQDGHLELVLPGKASDKKKKEPKYAYSLSRRYQNATIYKFNGIEFRTFQPDKPFFFYSKIDIPDKVQPGQSYNSTFRISNLGAYTAKCYHSFSFMPPIQVKVTSLKHLARYYRPGRQIFNISQKEYMRARHPLLEYTISPWPKKRTYTMKMELTIPKSVKDHDKLFILHRSSFEYRGRNTYSPSPQGSDYPFKTDQQGMPSYRHGIALEQ
jgi:hypothetical protein